MTSLLGRRNHHLVSDYRDELKLFRTPWQRFGLVLGLLAFLFIPVQFQDDLFGVDVLGVLAYGAVYAIGAIGLNLLIGYTGQISLGHAFFFAVGAYAAAYFGDDRGWPLLAYLAMAAVIGLVIGAVVGPFALRLRGDYLVVVTIGLVFVGEHLWKNWRSLTGGPGGRSVSASTSIGPFDFEELSLFGHQFSQEQGVFWFLWAMVILIALLSKNLVRTRPGRAMQAVRDRDLSAEVIGVSLTRYKIGAFAVSSAIGAVSGALFAVFLQGFVSYEDFRLLTSINFVAMIIIGGLGSISGSIMGAVVITALPRVIESNSDNSLFNWILEDSGGGSGFLSQAAFNQILFGMLIILFLILEPRGMAALWLRIKAYFATWPFSY
jgi:branched-chain amino acid transport system permease protein